MDALEYLFSLETLGMKFGLEGIRAVLGALGHPQRHYVRVIVAGTNGKGSVTAMAETAIRHAGHRVGRYTSPHLARLEERFVIDGREIETEAMSSAAAAVRDAAERLRREGRLNGPPTFFEATTAVAFELFRRAGVEVAVVEVGLGGRLDATNAEPSPLCAITSIDRDHEHLLGADLTSIAREKAGVIHRGAVAVLGDRTPEVVDVVRSVCRDRGARLVTRDGVQVAAVMSAGRARLALTTSRDTYGPVTLGLRGRHQADNAVTAVLLLEELAALGAQVPRQDIERGLAEARWPGRLELVRAGGAQVLFDAAHNPGGARALADYLAAEHPAGLPIVFGAMRDKDARSMLAALASRATAFVLTEASIARAAPAATLADAARDVAAGVPCVVEPDRERALARAIERSPLVCVTGSIVLVGDVRAALVARGGHPVP